MATVSVKREPVYGLSAPRALVPAMSIVQVATTSASSSSLTCTFSSAITAGNWIAAFMGSINSGTSTPSGGGVSSWTQQIRASRITISYGLVVTGGSTTVSCTTQGSFSGLWAAEIGGTLNGVVETSSESDTYGIITSAVTRKVAFFSFMYEQAGGGSGPLASGLPSGMTYLPTNWNSLAYGVILSQSVGISWNSNGGSGPSQGILALY